MLDNKNKSLKVKALEAEKENMKLNREVELCQRSVKEQQDKYKMFEYRFRLTYWLGKKLN